MALIALGAKLCDSQSEREPENLLLNRMWDMRIAQNLKLLLVSQRVIVVP